MADGQDGRSTEQGRTERPDRTRRILYLMAVDWRWIKQRPQHLAEQLSRRHHVLAVYRPSPRRFSWPHNRSPVRRIPLIPTLVQGPLRRRVDPWVQRRWLSGVAALFRPDVLWLGHPLLWPLLASDAAQDGRGHGRAVDGDRWRARAVAAQASLIYDCMDDVLALTPPGVTADEVQAAEAQLVLAADRILVSSQCLAQRLRQRYGDRVSEKQVLLRNGGGGTYAPLAVERSAAAAGAAALRIGYVGTIGGWFDWDSLAHCLAALPTLQIHLIGPVEAEHPLRAHPRIVCHGPVEHSQLSVRMQPLDALIMPFLRTPIVEAVDPVKLYEYLATGRPVFSAYYPEVERFAPHVYFYRQPDELLAWLRALQQHGLPARSSGDDRAQFLRDNSWEHRGRELEDVLSTLR